MLNKISRVNFFKDQTVHLKLKLQISFFIAVLCVSIVTCIAFFFLEKVNYKTPLLFFLLGLSFGIFTGRYKKMEWDEEIGKIMNKFDGIGIMVIIVNLIYIFFHKNIIRELTHIQKITCISFALVCGNMLGRLFLIFIRIRKIKTNILK